MKLFTDIDLDGLGCGILAKLAFGNEAYVTYCSYRNLNQRVDQFINNEDFFKTETYITDLAVNDTVEKKLDNRFKEGGHIRVIDHHVTAMHFNQYKWGLVVPEYETGKKACATSLFYDYLVEHQKLKKNKALDEFVDLVRQYDTWEWDENNNVTAKRLNDLFYILNKEEFEEEILKRLQENTNSFTLTEVENLLLDVEEQKIERYIRSKNRQLVQTFIDSYCVGIVHAEQYLSELGNALNKLNPHLDMIVLLNVGGKKMGFRTIYDHVDVSKFAAQFGGGGHPKASGCELGKETFKKFVADVFHINPRKPDPEKNELNIKDAPYGTCFENSQSEISYIIPLPNKTYSLIHNEKILDQHFDSFQNAENYLKRHHNSWLRFENDLLRHLSNKLSTSVEDVKKNYAHILKNVIETIEKK